MHPKWLFLPGANIRIPYGYQLESDDFAIYQENTEVLRIILTTTFPEPAWEKRRICLMSNLKNARDVLSTTTEPTAPEKLLATNLRHYDFARHYLTSAFCVILKQKAGLQYARERPQQTVCAACTSIRFRAGDPCFKELVFFEFVPGIRKDSYKRIQAMGMAVMQGTNGGVSAHSSLLAESVKVQSKGGRTIPWQKLFIRIRSIITRC